jgi:hypothetical protein
VNAKSERFDETVDADGYVKIPAPTPSFENAARLYTRSRWISVISPSSSPYRGEESAIVYPSNLWDPQYPSLTPGHELTIIREGWVGSQHLSTGYSLLLPQSERDALIGWFKSNGVDAHPSEEGRVAAQVISVPETGRALNVTMTSSIGTLSE